MQLISKVATDRVSLEVPGHVLANVAAAVLLAFEELDKQLGMSPKCLRDLAEHDLPGTALIVEITEGVLVSRDPTVDANLEIYRAAGLRFAIDEPRRDGTLMRRGRPSQLDNPQAMALKFFLLARGAFNAGAGARAARASGRQDALPAT